ncbi:cupin domain-containing protein [Sagittula stellata]|uniref:Cupin type-2 domain-containing protein n=1 Tax=Sagittula stellata (strain ATCC 700073 / DSM 11524 / E-37) TaxID=388399 RepID=A3K8C9_SAGS3|nr:hypothetical protein SSE37_10143 [Sagittula stellata E-37]
MPKIDLDSVPARTGSGYPAPYDAQVAGRSVQRLGDAGGLSQFGANLVRLAPGAMSSLRHWHVRQDEFVMMTQGELVLVEDSGETVLHPGDFCAFPAGSENGHHLVNRSEAEAAFLVIGTRTDRETGWFSETDLKVEIMDGQMRFTRRDGSSLGQDAGAAQPVKGEVFAALGKQLTKALLSGDFELYKTNFHLPMSVHPQSGEPYMLSSEAELREDFDLYHAALKAQGIDDIRREVIRVLRPDPESKVVEAEMHFLRGAETIVEPFVTTFRLENHGPGWRIARIISSLGHINWTRGLSRIRDNMKFELD